MDGQDNRELIKGINSMINAVDRCVDLLKGMATCVQEQDRAGIKAGVENAQHHKDMSNGITALNTCIEQLKKELSNNCPRTLYFSKVITGAMEPICDKVDSMEKKLNGMDKKVEKALWTVGGIGIGLTLLINIIQLILFFQDHIK